MLCEFSQDRSPTPYSQTESRSRQNLRASGVKPLNTKIRAGKASHAKQSLPAVLGVDMAGTVEDIGPRVTAFSRGDEVYGMVGGLALQGTLAEFIGVDTDLLAHKPKNVSMRQRPALPLVAITAWEALVDRAHVCTGQTVLINAGAGGVGHVAGPACARLPRQSLRDSLAGQKEYRGVLRGHPDRLSFFFR